MYVILLMLLYTLLKEHKTIQEKENLLSIYTFSEEGDITTPTTSVRH